MTLDDLESGVNIGPALAAALRRAGVTSLAVLRERGAVAVWRELRVSAEFDCAQSLWALVGAVAGVRWHQLPKEERAELWRRVRTTS